MLWSIKNNNKLGYFSSILLEAIRMILAASDIIGCHRGTMIDGDHGAAKKYASAVQIRKK